MGLYVADNTMYIYWLNVLSITNNIIVPILLIGSVTLLIIGIVKRFKEEPSRRLILWGGWLLVFTLLLWAVVEFLTPGLS